MSDAACGVHDLLIWLACVHPDVKPHCLCRVCETDDCSLLGTSSLRSLRSEQCSKLFQQLVVASLAAVLHRHLDGIPRGWSGWLGCRGGRHPSRYFQRLRAKDSGDRTASRGPSPSTDALLRPVAVLPGEVTGVNAGPDAPAFDLVSRNQSKQRQDAARRPSTTAAPERQDRTAAQPPRDAQPTVHKRTRRIGTQTNRSSSVREQK